MIVTNYELADGGHIEVRTQKSGGSPKTSAFRYDSRGDRIDGFDMTSQLGYLAGFVRCTKANMAKSHAEAVSRIGRGVKLGRILSHKIMDESTVPTFSDFVGERMSTSDWRRAEGLCNKGDLSSFDEACVAMAKDLVDDGYSREKAIDFLSERAAENVKEGVSESLVEGRTQEQACQKVYDAVEKRLKDSGSGDAEPKLWMSVAREECVRKGVPFAAFKEWMEAKDFAELPEAFDPSLLESKVELGVSKVDHNGESYEVKPIDSTHVYVRIPRVSERWIPYHIGQLDGALKDCALRVVKDSDQ